MTDSNGNNGKERLVVPAFTYLAGNIKGRFEHALTAKCVAFVGKNRRGKTARLDAVRIALTGKHPVGPHGTDFFELAPENALTLSALLKGPDRLLSSFAVEVEGGKAKKPPEKPERDGAIKLIESMPNAAKALENMMPTLAMRDLIKGATLTREAVFRRFGEITAIPTPRGLTEEQLSAWNRGIEETKRDKPKADTADLLSGVSAYFRRVKLEKGREIKALEKLLKEREAALAPAAAGSEDLPRLKQQLRDADSWERAEGLRTRKGELDTAAEAYRAKLQPLIALNKPEVIAQREAETAAQDRAKADTVATLKTQLEGIGERIKKELFYLTGGEWLMECIHIMASSVDAEGYSKCVLCGNRCHVSQLRKAVEPRVEARRKSVEAIYEEKKVVEKAIADAERTYAAWKTDVEQKRRREEIEKAELKNERDRLKAAMEENALALKDVPEAYEGLAAADLRARIKALEDAETANRQLDAEMAKLRQLNVDQDLYKLLEQEAARELNNLLTRTAETANATVNKYMPEGFRAQLNIEDAQWTVIGADGRAHGKKVMSGSEFGALVPALAQAWTEDAPARYVLLDDEDLAFFDPENLALLLSALKDACDDGLLTQVFIAWSRPHEIPDGWGQKIYIDAPGPVLAEPPPSTVPIKTESNAAMLL